jgi:hypothetical protein
MDKAIKIYKVAKILIMEVNMKNWKTTLAGLLGACGQLFGILGLPVEIGNAVSVIGLALLGLFAKDMNVSGGKVQQ